MTDDKGDKPVSTTPAPKPTPGMKPSQPKAKAPATSPIKVVDAQPAAEFGYVSEDGAAFIRLPDGNEHQVGQWKTNDESGALDIKAAMEFYTRRYDQLVNDIDLAATRLVEGKSGPKDARVIVDRVREATVQPSFIGDLNSLVARIGQLEVLIDVRTEVISQEREQYREKVLKDRDVLAAKAEELSKSESYKKTNEEFQELVEKWKSLPRFDRKREDELWKRVSSSRTSFDKRRRAYYAKLDEKRVASKASKEAIIKRAAVLSGSRDWAKTSTQFRKLMDEWKAAGRTGKSDDKLWAKFKAEQDKFYEARKDVYAEQNKEEEAALEVKMKLVEEAESLLPITNITDAKKKLHQIQDRWEKAGRIPKKDVRQVEGRFEKVEREINAFGKSNVNPEKRGRALDTVDQFQEAVDKYTRHLERAKAEDNKRDAKEAQASLDNAQMFLKAAQERLKDIESA